jgi:hypothetical protein
MKKEKDLQDEYERIKLAASEVNKIRDEIEEKLSI